jgi:hypothetical protein
VSRRYIWGDESYAPEYTEINYRKQAGLMWKADFPAIFCKGSSDLHSIREKYIKYLDDGNTDVMYLLEKEVEGEANWKDWEDSAYGVWKP